MPLISFTNKIATVPEFVLRPIKNALRQVYFKEVVIWVFFFSHPKLVQEVGYCAFKLTTHVHIYTKN